MAKERPYAELAAGLGKEHRVGRGSYPHPVIVLLGSGKYAGRYDWFPEGEPLPKGAVVVNRWENGRWRNVGHAGA